MRSEEHDSTPILGLTDFRRRLKYGLSYKWMNFSSRQCPTFDCDSTVTWCERCVQKNQLGNVALGFLIGLRWSNAAAYDAIVWTYRGDSPGVSTYPASHPHSWHRGPANGSVRRDNIVAFAIGLHLARVVGSPVRSIDDCILAVDSNCKEIPTDAVNIFNHIYINEFIRNRSRGDQDPLLLMDFVVRWHNGRKQNTSRECELCDDSFEGPSSREVYLGLVLESRRRGRGTDFDTWVQEAYENY